MTIEYDGKLYDVRYDGYRLGCDFILDDISDVYEIDDSLKLTLIEVPPAPMIALFEQVIQVGELMLYENIAEDHLTEIH